ncbi:MAG TPA: AAA family ATPase [Mucilaginibacter sp.]|jgi:predicted ATPase|nr:AAA family ATPase [Mucilaginibacter sp.]
MAKIRIRNFGPIKEGCLDDDGWIDIKKVTVFIGNQGSGKSTVAKLISTFTWMEKVLTRGNYDKREFEVNGVLKQYLEYHKIDDYAELYIKGIKQLDHSEIEYVGDAYSFSYRKRTLTIKERSANDYPLPQIMYVPADRNFLSSIEDLKTQRIFSPALREVLDELDKAKKEIKEELPLPINGAYLEYDRQKDILYVKGENYKIKLSDASSGFQSFVPLFVVSRYLTNFINGQSETKEPMTSDELNKFRKDIADIYSNNDLTSEQKRAAASAVSDRYNKSAFINIVEEPEQNLFPTSQWQMLKCLLEFNNMNEGNKLIITTHSPYIINYLSIAIEGYSLKNKIDASAKASELLRKMHEIIPAKSLISAQDVAIYQLNETDGSISKLPTYEGIPTDKNYLNMILREGNQIFDSLLEIEEEI